MLSGCGLYLHDNSFATTAAQAKDDFVKVDASQVFTQQQKVLSDFVAADDKAVAANALAQRDNLLAAVIHPIKPDEMTARRRLESQIDNDLRDLYGEPAPDPQTRSDLLSLPNVVASNAEQVANHTVVYDAQVRSFNQIRSPGDGRKTDCTSVLEIPAKTVPSGPSADEYYEFIRNECAKLQELQNATLLPDPSKVPGGTLHAALLNMQDARALVAKDKRDAVDFQAKLNKIITPSAPPSTTEEAQKTLAEARSALKGASGFAAKAGWTTISNALDSLLQNELTSPGSLQGSSGASAGQRSATTPAPVLLGLVFDTTTLADSYAKATALEHVNSLLIARAEVQHNLNIAKIQIDQEMDLERISRLEVVSLTKQLRHLDNAKKYAAEIGGSQPNFDAIPEGSSLDNAGLALAEWVTSRNEGAIPNAVFGSKEVQVKRAYAVKLAAATSSDFHALLKPVFDELDAYGKGGISAESTARLLADLGLLSALVAK